MKIWVEKCLQIRECKALTNSLYKNAGQIALTFLRGGGGVGIRNFSLPGG